METNSLDAIGYENTSTADPHGFEDQNLRIAMKVYALCKSIGYGPEETKRIVADTMALPEEIPDTAECIEQQFRKTG